MMYSYQRTLTHCFYSREMLSTVGSAAVSIAAHGRASLQIKKKYEEKIFSVDRRSILRF